MKGNIRIKNKKQKKNIKANIYLVPVDNNPPQKDEPTCDKFTRMCTRINVQSVSIYDATFDP